MSSPIDPVIPEVVGLGWPTEVAPPEPHEVSRETSSAGLGWPEDRP